MRRVRGHRPWRRLPIALLALAGTSGAFPTHAADGAVETPRPPRIERVVFEGNRAFEDRQLLRWMRQRPSRPFLGSPYDDAEFLQDLERLRRLYIGEGYLDAVITAKVDSTRRARGSVDLRLDVREGPRWLLLGRALNLSGPERSPALAESLASVLEVGAPGPYRLSALVTDRDRLVRNLAARGLLDAQVRVQVARDDSCRTALLRYVVDTGPRARLHELRVHGLVRTRRSVFDREVRIHANAVLVPADLGATRANLIRTGLFSDVQVTPAASDSGVADKDVVIAVRELPSGSLGAGAGYGTSDRARISASLEHRNLYGHAVRAALRGVYGQRRRGAEVELFFPWTFGRRLATTLGAAHEHLSPRSYTAEKSRGSLLVSRPVGIRWKLDLGYSVEKVHLLRSRADGRTPEVGRLGRLSFSAARDSRRDLFLPRRGAYTRLQSDWTSPFLGGRQHFVRAEAEHRAYVTLGALTLSSRARGGWIVQQDAARPVPVTERYFAGGLQTLRGFPEEAVGPVDPSGVARGGRILVLAAVEGRVPIRGWLTGSLFVDAGQLVDHADALATRAVSAGAGGGLQIDAPIGRLRLAVSWPITRRFGGGAQLYAGTGSSF